MGRSDRDDDWATLATLVAHDRGLAADLPDLNGAAGAESSLQMLAPGDETYDTVSAWLDSYITKPHPELGRSGAVCPFVAPALSADTVWIAAYRFDGEPTLEAMNRALEESLRCFQLLAWQGDKIDLASLVVTFPDLTREDWHLIDDGHAASKTTYVEAGAMLGQFHPECEAPAARNPEFPVNRAPIPLMAIRHIAAHDILFLDENPHWVEHFGAWLERRKISLHHTYRRRFEQVRRRFGS